MKFRLEYDEGSNFILVTMEGEATREDFLALGQEVLKLVEKTGCHRYLNDMRGATVAMSPFEIFEMPRFLADMGVGPEVKRAIVWRSDDEGRKFFETVAQNQGLNVRVFEDAESARKWLLE